MTTTEIATLADLTAVISNYGKDYDGPIWYRGHGNCSWPLLPSYYRIDARLSEHSLLIKFRQSATMLLERPPSDPFEWMFLMQHYGVPTRLLDWSESPLVALYFCVTSTLDADASIWMLKPPLLNKHSRIKATAQDGHVLSFHDDELKTYTIDSLRNNTRIDLLPLAAVAIRNNPRIQAQLGVFTVHHHDRVPIEAIEDGSHVCKTLIRKEHKVSLRRELNILGFSQFQLFPELTSVGEILAGEIQ